jgi:hypothetical protein
MHLVVRSPQTFTFRTEGLHFGTLELLVHQIEQRLEQLARPLIFLLFKIALQKAAGLLGAFLVVMNR